MPGHTRRVVPSCGWNGRETVHRRTSSDMSRWIADSAKVGILFGSLVAGVTGYAFLRTVPEKTPA